MDINIMVDEVGNWRFKNFGENKEGGYDALLGMTEELGELCHAHLKMVQGIRGGYEEHHQARIDAIGDMFIYLCDYCHANKIDLEEAIKTTWDIVKQRDWKKNPENGC